MGKKGGDGEEGRWWGRGEEKTRYKFTCTTMDNLN